MVSPICPNVVGLNVNAVPVIYYGGIGFSNVEAACDAVGMLPFVTVPNARDEFLTGRSEEDDNGLYSSVMGTKDSQTAAKMNKDLVPQIRGTLDSGGLRSVHTVDEAGSKKIFGETSGFGKFYVEVSRHTLNVPAAVDGERADEVVGSKSETFTQYALRIGEFNADGVSTSDRIETSLAALLGLERGIVGIGIMSTVDARVGFGSGDDIFALPLRKFLYSLDQLFNTDRIDAGVVGSAFFMGSPWLDLGPIQPELGGLVFIKSVAVSQLGNAQIKFALRLVNLTPVSKPLGEIKLSEKGVLPVRMAGGGQSGLELLVIPPAGNSFNTQEIEILHGVAEKCRDLLYQTFLH